mmetsp:Transcript_56110/g.65528  ORF Transcript_56110/g.65528 Transcript_56110/m.65528 type:complete len:80 (-) Transcript_56110:34-273(-)
MHAGSNDGYLVSQSVPAIVGCDNMMGIPFPTDACIRPNKRQNTFFLSLAGMNRCYPKQTIETIGCKRKMLLSARDFMIR